MRFLAIILLMSSVSWLAHSKVLECVGSEYELYGQQFPLIEAFVFYGQDDVLELTNVRLRPDAYRIVESSFALGQRIKNSEVLFTLSAKDCSYKLTLPASASINGLSDYPTSLIQKCDLSVRELPVSCSTR